MPAPEGSDITEVINSDNENGDKDPSEKNSDQIASSDKKMTKDAETDEYKKIVESITNNDKSEGMIV